MSENNERNFDLGTVLSITTGRVFTNQLPRVAEIAQPYITKKVLGDSFALSPMPEEMCEHINPIKEAEQMILSRTKNL